MGSLGLKKEQQQMVITLLAGAVLVVLSQTLLSPALPSIMNHLQVNATTVQWLTSAYALTEAVVIPLAAWFMGRFSTRTLFIGGMALFGIGSLVAALAPVFSVLLIGRILQAMATGVLMAMVIALILLSFPRESRGAAMGIVGLVIGFAPAIGPTVGGFLVDVIGWRALFAVIVVLTAVVILLALKFLKNYEGFPRSKFDTASVAFSSLGLASLLYGLSSFASSTHVEICIALIVFGGVFVGLFVRRQFKLDEPLLRLEVLKSRRYRTASLAIFFLQATLIGLNVLLPLYIQNVLGHSATVSGLITLPGAVLGALAGLGAGRIFDRSGVRLITLIGGCLLVVSGIGMLFFDAYSAIWFVIAVNALCSICVQFITTPINTWGINSLSNDLVQHATSVTNTINQIGGSLGTALIMSFSAIGTSLATQGSEVERICTGYHFSFCVALVFLIVIFVIVLLRVRDLKGDRVLEASAPSSPKDKGRTLVSDIMNTDTLVIPTGTSLSKATELLAQNNSSGAAVVAADQTMCGFISNSDILRYFSDEMMTVAGGSFSVTRLFDNESVQHRARSMANVSVDDVATKKVISIQPDALFEEACNLLAQKRLKQLPVMSEGKLLGTVHRSQLMEYLAQTIEETRK